MNINNYLPHIGVLIVLVYIISMAFGSTISIFEVILFIVIAFLYFNLKKTKERGRE